jgi:hypothetical protein
MCSGDSDKQLICHFWLKQCCTGKMFAGPAAGQIVFFHDIHELAGSN